MLEGVTEFGGQEHFYLETHASLAHVDSEGQIFVESSTQHPSETQEIVAHVMHVPSHRVTVQALRMGGAFGGKEMQPHGLAAIAALGASLTGRPVRLRLNRTQDLTMTGKRHPFHIAWRAGLDADGSLLALEATLTSDGGWCLDLSEPVMSRALCHVDNAYWIPNVHATGRIAKTHKTSNTAFRGFGGPQGVFLIEDILGRGGARARHRPDRAAAAQLLPRRAGDALRADREGCRAHARDLVERCATRPLSTSAARRSRSSTPENEHTKRALAMTPVKFGISFNFTAYNQAGALVHVYKDGSVLINHGGTEMGQGLHTKMLQVAATALGVPLASVRLAPTRTDKVPNTSATAASSGADLNGAAVKNACEQIRERMRPIAAGLLRAAEADVVFSGGAVTASGSGRSVTFAEVVDGVVLRARAALGGRVLPDGGPALGHRAHAGLAVQVLRVRRRGDRGGGRRLHRRVPRPSRRHPARRGRFAVAADRPGPDRGRLRAGCSAGSRSKSCGGTRATARVAGAC